MRETILKCNQCRKVILDPTLAVSVEKDMATTVFGGKSNDTLSLWFGSSQRRVSFEKDQDFCGIQCLSEWIAEQAGIDRV